MFVRGLASAALRAELRGGAGSDEKKYKNKPHKRKKEMKITDISRGIVLLSFSFCKLMRALILSAAVLISSCAGELRTGGGSCQAAFEAALGEGKSREEQCVACLTAKTPQGKACGWCPWATQTGKGSIPHALPPRTW